MAQKILPNVSGSPAEISFGNRVFDVTGHGLPRTPAGADQIRKALGIGLVHIEHQLVGVWLIEREVEISPPNGIGPRGRAALDAAARSSAAAKRSKAAARTAARISSLS